MGVDSNTRILAPLWPCGKYAVLLAHIVIGSTWHPDFISQKVSIKSFCKGQFPHKFVNILFIAAIIKDKLTDLCGK